MLKRSTAVLLAGCVACSLSGCSGQQKRTGIGAAIGTAVGAGAGAVIGHQSGHGIEGAVIGGAIGAGAGGVTGHQMGKTKFCPDCGKRYQTEDTFCKKCGTELRAKQ